MDVSGDRQRNTTKLHYVFVMSKIDVKNRYMYDVVNCKLVNLVNLRSPSTLHTYINQSVCLYSIIMCMFLILHIIAIREQERMVKT